MTVQRATVEIRTSRLSSEFGEAMAARWFTAEELALWPRLKAGKNKGKLVGIIEWKKCTEGGWRKGQNGGVGGVVRPGTRDVQLMRTERIGGMTRQRIMVSRGRVNACASDAPPSDDELARTPGSAAWCETYGDNH